METEGYGESVLALTVDVNENEDAGKSFVSSQIDHNIGGKAHPLEENRACPATEGQVGKGHVYAASNGRNVNNECDVEPSQYVRAGNSVILDLVADCLPTRLKDSCVISDLCNEHTLNGFTDSSVQVMVGLESGSNAAEGGRGGTLSCRDTAGLVDREEEGNGMLLPLDRVSEKDEDCSGETPNFNIDNLDKGSCPKAVVPSLEPTLSCLSKHELNCTCSDVLNMTMPNGEADCLSNYDKDVDVSYSSPKHTSYSLRCQGHGSTDKEIKVANGGLHIVKKSAACDFELPSTQNITDVPVDIGMIESHLQYKNIRSSATFCESNSGGLSHECPREAAPAAGEPAEEVGSTLDPDVSIESSANIHSLCPSTLSINTSDSQITESSAREDFSESSVPARPLSLRTNPNTALSLSCDATPLSPEDGDFYGAEGYIDPRNTYEVSRRQSAPDTLPDESIMVSNPSDQRLISKKFGIADFFTRSLFSRKPKESKPPSQNAPGWRLFGKVPLRDSDDSKDSMAIQQEASLDRPLDAEADEPSLSPPGEFPVKEDQHRPLSAGRRKNLEFEPLSTTALILEDRPANLPAKSEEEAQRHRQEYDEMVAGAKRRELKEAQRKKRQMKERIRQEESIASAMVIWNNDILPHWETMRNTRRVRDLWWQGLPPSVRGRVWSLAIGNELNITPELYEIFLSRAKEKWRSYSETSSENEIDDCGASLADRESSLDLIKLDISRTFPSLFIFQKGGPYHDLLHSVLGAYTCYRPDIGYVQGMSFIAAVLILNLEEADAFITFANLLNKPCQMAFFRVDHDLMLKYFAAFEVFFEENLPRLFSHFQTNNLTPDLYLIDWIFTLYSKSLPLDVACRVWDVFCRDGEESLFRTGLGILRLYQDVLQQMDFIHMAQFLTRLPEDMAAHALFSCMATTHMLSSNRRWGQVFSALMKDGSKEADKNNSPALRS
ncbi:TBC1 domain family member 12 isoform X1 [Osmerus mordax]|uniref:TBC1 domain family member 12 isoform X1 n=2 Tax=Osmerus mordax TaxID=8014 RepID=UPI00350F68FC